MIVRVLPAGRHMPGLVRYLTGPGKANEHTDPRVVAASGTLAVEYAGADWDSSKQGEFSRVLDGAWREARRSAGLGVVPVAGEEATSTAEGPAHVFHAALSLSAEEGQLDDETWSRIASDYVDALEFTDRSGKAECQWAAVRHGLSKAGNDHIHVVVCLVREDGTRASDWRSHVRSRAAADEIERRYGLRPVKDHPAERGLPGHTGAEDAKAARQGRAEPDRHQVARRLRAAAATSTSEADFVQSARLSGLLVRPRFATGSTTTVVGYAAALRPTEGQAPVWFAGGKLDRNLALPRLRERWPAAAGPAADQDANQDANQDAARAAVGEWQAANAAWVASDDVVGDVAGDQVPAGADLADAVGGWEGLERVDLPVEAARDIARVNKQLASVDPADRQAWARAAMDAAGVTAAWSVHVEGERPGPLARASDALARAAQPRRGEPSPAPIRPGMAGRHLRLLVRAGSTDPGTGWVGVLRQLRATTAAIQHSHQARGELQRAAALEAGARRNLDVVHQRMEAATTATAAATVAPTTSTRSSTTTTRATSSSTMSRPQRADEVDRDAVGRRRTPPGTDRRRSRGRGSDRDRDGRGEDEHGR